MASSLLWIVSLPTCHESSIKSLLHNETEGEYLDEIGDSDRHGVHRPLQIGHGISIFSFFVQNDESLHLPSKTVRRLDNVSERYHGK